MECQVVLMKMFSLLFSTVVGFNFNLIKTLFLSISKSQENETDSFRILMRLEVSFLQCVDYSVRVFSSEKLPNPFCLETILSLCSFVVCFDIGFKYQLFSPAHFCHPVCCCCYYYALCCIVIRILFIV